MIRRLFLVNGTLLAPIATTTDDIAVDADTAAKLLAGLPNVGDYCYLTIGIESEIEVVKILRDYEGFDATRGQAGTVARTFPSGTPIHYALTSAEIQDAVKTAKPIIFGDGYGIVDVVNTSGTLTVSILNPVINCVGGIEAVLEDDNTIVITDSIGAFGCCGSSVTGAPGIDGPFFYLTTSPYAYRAVEGLTGQPEFDGKGNGPLMPLNFGWLLTQPSWVEGITSDASVLSGNLYGSATSFSSSVEWLSSSVSLLDSNMYGGAKTYSSPVEGLSTDGYPLIGQLFGSNVTYNNMLDWLSSSVTVLNGTLA